MGDTRLYRRVYRYECTGRCPRNDYPGRAAVPRPRQVERIAVYRAQLRQTGTRQADLLFQEPLLGGNGREHQGTALLIGIAPYMGGRDVGYGGEPPAVAAHRREPGRYRRMGLPPHPGRGEMHFFTIPHKHVEFHMEKEKGHRCRR